MPTIISTALPKEAFNRPERVWPSLRDSWSVAVPRSYARECQCMHVRSNWIKRTAARGIIAMKLKEKRRAASQFNLWEMMLRGTKTRRMLRYEPKMKNLYECHHDG